MAWIFTLLAVMTAQIAGTSLYFAFWCVRPVYITVQPPTPQSAIWLLESEAIAKRSIEIEAENVLIWSQTHKSNNDAPAAFKADYQQWFCGTSTFPEGKR